MRRRTAMCALAIVFGIAGCKKKQWVVGTWVHVDDDGKPAACHIFKKDRTFQVFQDPECGQPADTTLSGKWQLKADTKLAIQRSGEDAVRIVSQSK